MSAYAEHCGEACMKLRGGDLTTGVLLLLEKLAGELGLEPSPTRPPDDGPGAAPRVTS